MIPDLSPDSEAVRPSPVRKVPQPTILPKTPLTGNGTTSSGATGGGGYSERTFETRQRREEIHAITNPPPDAYDIAVARHRARVAADEASEKRQREEMRERIRRDEQRLKDIRARQDNLRKFHAAEKLVEVALDGLSQPERSRVFERLLAANKAHDAELAACFANEEIAGRGNRAPEPSNTMDWRQALAAKK